MSARTRAVVLAVEEALRRRIRILLETNAYHVQLVASQEEALSTLALTVPELVLYAPVADEPRAFSLLRDATTAPLIVLTPLAGECVASTIEAGADDAIPPPHSRSEILARLALALRRSRPASVRRVLHAGALALDVESREVRIGERSLTLTRLEYRLLEALMLAEGHAVAHDDLLAQVWGPAHRGRLHYLRVYVARLRRKIELSSAQRIIVSIAGVGYRLGMRSEAS